MTESEAESTWEAKARDYEAQLRPAYTALNRARKSLNALQRGTESVPELAEHLGVLVKTPTEFDMRETHGPLVEALESKLTELKLHSRGRLIRGLRERCEAEGLREPVQLAANPLTLLLSPLTVELDFDAGEGRLLFAREVVETCPLVAESVLEARSRAMKHIQDQAIDAADFFDMLLAAYRMVLVTSGGSPGDRVDIVEMLAPLAILRSGKNPWRRDDLSGVTPFPRYMLAYQLRRLRRERTLERGGWRLELGTATGGSTRDKRNVLFLPTRGGEGQYYLSIRFARG